MPRIDNKYFKCPRCNTIFYWPKKRGSGYNNSGYCLKCLRKYERARDRRIYLRAITKICNDHRYEKPVCMKCESKRKLEIHHKFLDGKQDLKMCGGNANFYKLIVDGFRGTGDLLVLCEKCHQEIHKEK